MIAAASLLVVPRPKAALAALAAVGVLLAAVAGYGDALSETIRRWAHEEEYSYAFLVPVLSAWLIWTRRDSLPAAMGRPEPLAPVLMLIAMAMNAVGELSATYIFSQWSLVLAIAALILSAGGRSLFRATWVPVVFLLFAIPAPYFIASIMSIKLQLISSALGASFIRTLGIPVFLEGNIIDLGAYKLQVADACSGLRYLYPLLSLSFVVAYFFQVPLWKRAVVVVSSIPIAIALNGLRIGLVGVTVAIWGNRATDQFLHLTEGGIVFLACAAALALEVQFFASVPGRGIGDVLYLPRPDPVGAGAGGSNALRSAYPLIASLLILLISTAAVFVISKRSENIPARPDFVAFPNAFGGWKGHASLLDPETKQGLGLADYLLSDYASSDDKAVNLYVAYYSSQRKGESPHSPIVCIPGGGWRILTFERTGYSVDGVEAPVNRAVIERNSTKEVVYYWFDERGRQIANEYLAKFYLLVDAIALNRTDGALVRLATQVHPGETESDADRRLITFMRDASPRICRRILLAKSGSVASAQTMVSETCRDAKEDFR
jgi:exosortase D (VPLPA-CTERM-specific)